MPPRSVILFEDETILRLFPNPRRAWSLKGEQGRITTTGCNDQRVLFGPINIHAGHKAILKCRYMRQGDFQDFLKLLRQRYIGRPVWLLPDRAN